MNKLLRTLINNLKPTADDMGVGQLLRQSYVETRLIGERLKFGLSGRPQPASAILLAGSGRSGTTWITDVLCALPGVQQIFEPLFPPWNETVREITGWEKNNPYIRSLYLHPEEDDPAWEGLWQKILTGQYRNYWTDYERNSWFPDRFLIKEVRANMMLAFLYKKFQPRIIYILRHPCAVVYSRLTVPVPWHADIQDILVQERLVADHLAPHVGAMEKEKDLVGAHAVWWAVENHVAMQQLKTVPHYLVYYEDLVLRPSEILESLLPWLGYTEMPDQVAALLPQPSRMSNERLAYQDSQDRLSRWRHELPADDQARVLAWVERLDLNMYDGTCLPRDRSSVYAP